MKDRTTDQSIETADLDPKVAPIVRALNTVGYLTWNSCQGGPGHGTIVGLIELETDELSSIDKQIISDTIKEYTNVPFSIKRSSRQLGGTFRIVFTKPL